MEAQEWQVVRYRKNRLPVTRKVSSERKPKSRDEHSKTALLKFYTTSPDPASPAKMQEVEFVVREEPENGCCHDNCKLSMGGDRRKQRDELFLKCQKALEKVRRSPFFHRFMEQLQQLHQGASAGSLPLSSFSTDVFQVTSCMYVPASNREVGSSYANEHQTLTSHDGLERVSPFWKQHLQLVVYGVGSIQDSEVSRCQISLALLLKETLPFIVSSKVYDPVLTPVECLALQDLGLTPLEHNENGKMRFSAPTLFYMPHCEAGLYDEVMKSNMHLVISGQAIILGNSFKSYQDRWSLPYTGRKSLRPDLLLELAEVVEEHPVDTRAFPVQAAFNDTSWHFFQPPFVEAKA